MEGKRASKTSDDELVGSVDSAAGRAHETVDAAADKLDAAAEKIVRQELLRLGASSRFLIVPGATNGSTPAALPVPLAGSVQEDALKNPLVQRAKEIFHAEVRSVVDLRVK